MLEFIGIKREEILLAGDQPLIELELIESANSADNSGKLFLKKTNISGIFTFGCEQLVPEWLGKKRGYIWPSRPSAINFSLNRKLIAARYKQFNKTDYQLCAIDYDTLDSFLDKAKYRIVGPETIPSIDLLYRVIQINTEDKNNF